MASANTEYPKVLLVYNMLISGDNPRTQHFMVWFQDWPRDRLAQVCTGDEMGCAPFTKHVYRLGAEDRRMGALMQRQRSGAVRKAGSVQVLSGQSVGGLKVRAARWVMRSGLWELVFKIRLSDALKSFVSEFDPDVIYAQGYTLGLCQLPLLLNEWRSIPLCFHTADDWPTRLYADSPVCLLMRPVVKDVATRLIRRAQVRIAFTGMMKQEYESRYRVPFHDVIGPVVDMKACAAAEPVASCPGEAITVVYAGSMQGDRCRAAIDMAKAVQLLRKEGTDIVFVCYNLDAAREAAAELEQLGAIVKAPIPVEQVPGILRGAGILFLPEWFNETDSSWISLSLSSKVPYCIAAQRPIVVYGSALTGVAQHAEAEGWAVTVVERAAERLADCLRRLLQTGLKCNHSEDILTKYEAKYARSRLLSMLLGLRERATAGTRRQPGADRI